jgi:hypothetical protein
MLCNNAVCYFLLQLPYPNPEQLPQKNILTNPKWYDILVMQTKLKVRLKVYFQYAGVAQW